MFTLSITHPAAVVTNAIPLVMTPISFRMFGIILTLTLLSKIPVIVLTNLDSEEKVSREIGAVDYFIKSEVTPNQIIARIKELLKKRLG